MVPKTMEREERKSSRLAQKWGNNGNSADSRLHEVPGGTATNRSLTRTHHGTCEDRGMQLLLIPVAVLLSCALCASGARVRGKAAPTVPGEKDSGAAVVSTPVEPKTEMLKLSPEQVKRLKFLEC